MNPPGAAEVSRTSRRAWWPLALCLLACVAATAGTLHFPWKVDDAFITFAYAKNWVQGHGIVFNAGEYVEGYTCFLWVAFSALGLRLGADIVQWSTALGVLGLIGAIVVTWRFARELVPERVTSASVFAALIVAGYPCLWWWAASGMETTVFTFLITAAMWRHVRSGADSLAAPVCLALASMTRPEAWLLSALLCLDAIRLGSRRSTVRYVIVFLGIFAPYYAWRFWYYGDPLPNTFYAKVGETSDQLWRGWMYLRSFLLQGGGALLIAGALIALLTGTARRLAPLYVFLAAYFVYVVLVGGDVFFFYRFLVPVIPLLAVLSVAGILRGINHLRPRPIAGHAAALAFLGALAWWAVSLTRSQLTQLPPNHARDALNRRMCPQLVERTKPDESLAAIAVGYLKFCTGRRVIDMVGLADRHIARHDVPGMGRGLAGHERYDSLYVLAQHPRYIIIPAKRFSASLKAAADMHDQPIFQADYYYDGVAFRRRD